MVLTHPGKVTCTVVNPWDISQNTFMQLMSPQFILRDTDVEEPFMTAKNSALFVDKFGDVNLFVVYYLLV